MKSTGFKLLVSTIASAMAMSGSPAKAEAQAAFRDLYDKSEFMIPMRDGTRLYASVYHPKNRPGKHPILLERTPYGAGPYGPTNLRTGVRGSRRFVESGYIFAYEDVRGRGKSEGVFVNDRPLLINRLKPNDVDESTDTYDTIAFLTKAVSDNNGRVGLWGISYPGFYAAIGAVNSHPALKAASPQAPVSDWFIGDDFHHNGALFLMDAVGFARFGESPAARKRSPVPELSTNDPYRFYLQHSTLAELTETYFKNTDGLWKFIMDHGTYDEYWQSRNLPSHMNHVHCAVMTVGGWFDAEDCWGALHTYRGIEAQNRGIPNTLVMGPWYHGMWAGERGDRFGNIDWGQQTSRRFQEEIEFPFFDTYLRGDGTPGQPEAQVFETGSNRWLKFAHWPPIERKERSLYLQPGRLAGWQRPGPQTPYDEYVSDPSAPVPYQGGKIEDRTREYMIDDQRFAASRSDVLSYQTPVLGKPLRLAGPVAADLFIQTSATDADFIVKVIDVYPNDAPGKLAGYQMLLRADVMRSKFRNSYANPAPLSPSKIESVSFNLADVCHAFLPGHRLMIQIQSSWFPLVDRNPQQFEDIYTARPEDFQKAAIRVFHSPDHPSRLRVGVL